MRVYRIENKQGYGPFNAGHVRYDQPAYRNPCPEREVQDGCQAAADYLELSYETRRHFRFGFETLAQIREWFDENAIEALRKNRFSVNCYEVSVENVYLMFHQLTFHIEYANFIERIPYGYLLSDEVFYESEIDQFFVERYSEGVEIPSESQAV